MSDIIEHGSNDPEAVRIQTSSSSDVSLKVYQDIYHQITGKTEEIRQSFKDSILIQYSDIEQLHTKITQLFDVHHVVAFNEAISLYYEKDRKEQYASFDKFKAFNANGTSPVSNIEIKYSISIIPAKLSKPQEYTITIRLSSRVTQIKQLKEESPSFFAGPFVFMIASETAQIKIEYVDYVIARGFLEAFKEWVDGCKKSKSNKLVIFCQKYSHLIPFIGKLIIAIVYGYFIYYSIDPIIGKDPSLVVFSKFLVVSSVVFF